MSDSVLNFTLIAKDKNFSTLDNDYTYPPYLIEITLTLASKDVINRFNNMPAGSSRNKYLLANAHTFKRSVYLSKKWDYRQNINFYKWWKKWIINKITIKN